MGRLCDQVVSVKLSIDECRTNFLLYFAEEAIIKEKLGNDSE